MKYSKTDFLAADHSTIMVDEWIEEDGRDDLLNTDVEAIEKCHVTGSLYFDGKELVSSNLELSGTMIIKDSISNEDLTVDFDTETERLYSFAQSDQEDIDVYFAPRETIDLRDEIFEAIAYAAPIGYSIIESTDYPKGEGWELVSESDLEEEEFEDPRWAKLKELSFDE